MRPSALAASRKSTTPSPASFSQGPHPCRAAGSSRCGRSGSRSSWPARMRSMSSRDLTSQPGSLGGQKDLLPVAAGAAHHPRRPRSSRESVESGRVVGERGVDVVHPVIDGVVQHLRGQGHIDELAAAIDDGQPHAAETEDGDLFPRAPQGSIQHRHGASISDRPRPPPEVAAEVAAPSAWPPRDRRTPAPVADRSLEPARWNETVPTPVRRAGRPGDTGLDD